jgi:hypothetical protein
MEPPARPDWCEGVGSARHCYVRRAPYAGSRTYVHAALDLGINFVDTITSTGDPDLRPPGATGMRTERLSE